nr:hypothetical transcript [Hymenolepis microstoma]CUU98720.1 hypothetical transcript [Hymenolepis microstoma]
MVSLQTGAIIAVNRAKVWLDGTPGLRNPTHRLCIPTNKSNPPTLIPSSHYILLSLTRLQQSPPLYSHDFPQISKQQQQQ